MPILKHETRLAPIKRNEPWRDTIPPKSIMSSQEISERYNHDSFLNYVSGHENYYKPYSSKEGETIRQDLEEMAAHVIAYLQGNYKLFEGCSLIKSGSSYEGVKIGPPDEFDFMIEVPAVCSRSIADFQPGGRMGGDDSYFPGGGKKFFERLLLEIRNEADKVLSRSSRWTQKIEQGIEKDTTAFRAGQRVRQEERRDRKYDKARVALQKGDGYKVATTVHFIWNGDEYRDLQVDVDFCIAVPIYVNPQNLSEFFYLSEISKDDQENYFNCHALIRSQFVWRISFSLAEMNIMRTYPYPEGQNKCMRILKYLRDTEIDMGKNPETGDAFYYFPSYWIKTVLYGLYQKYPDHAAWEGEELGKRVVEALDILADACDRIELPNFFFPSTDILKNFFGNIVPGTRHIAIDLRKLRDRFLF